MANFNTSVRYLPKAQRNPHAVDWSAKFLGQDNAEFLAETAKALAALGKQIPHLGSGIASIVLVGEFGLFGYRLRHAQDVLRFDRTASFWSQALLLVEPLSTDPNIYRDPKLSPWAWESTLQPPGRYDDFARRYGVAPRRLVDYVKTAGDATSPVAAPNLAVVCVSLTDEERTAILERADQPAIDQVHYDLPGLLGSWANYLLRADGTPSPLAEGHAVYSSAYVQLAYDAAGIDLAPGANQRNIAPEHIWQTATFLQHQLPPSSMERSGSTGPWRLGPASEIAEDSWRLRI